MKKLFLMLLLKCVYSTAYAAGGDLVWLCVWSCCCEGVQATNMAVVNRDVMATFSGDTVFVLCMGFSSVIVSVIWVNVGEWGKG